MGLRSFAGRLKYLIDGTIFNDFSLNLSWCLPPPLGFFGGADDDCAAGNVQRNIGADVRDIDGVLIAAQKARRIELNIR
jgi:hypothetical protein